MILLVTGILGVTILSHELATNALKKNELCDWTCKAFIPELAVASTRRKGEGQDPQLTSWHFGKFNNMTKINDEKNVVYNIYRCLLKNIFHLSVPQKTQTNIKIFFSPKTCPHQSFNLRNDSSLLTAFQHRGVQMKVVVLEKLQQKGQQRHCLHPSRRLKAKFLGQISKDTKKRDEYPPVN